MAEKRSPKRKPGGAAGRAPLTEPKIQLFNRFAGCDFRLSPREFDAVYASELNDPEQTDLLMNYMVIQNNVRLAPNMTLESRQNIVKLFDAPPDKELTGVATLVGDRLFAACSDKSIHHGRLEHTGVGNLLNQVAIDDRSNDLLDNTWTFLGQADDTLVGLTAGKQIWTGVLDDFSLNNSYFHLANALYIPDPVSSLPFSSLSAVGSLTISQTWSQATPFRISICHTLLNKYGPTLPSPFLTFFASKPTSEWSSNAYVSMSGTIASGTSGIIAIEIYYIEGEYTDPIFLTRIGLTPDADVEKSWRFNWLGYFYDTSIWTIANLSIPSMNYTRGVPATRMASHDGQLYFWGGDPPHRIWIGGNPGNRFSVSTGTGGGFVDCEPGSGTIVREVLKFKTQQGASIVTALCDNKNSQKEHRFNLVESSISLNNEQSVKAWQAEKISGTVGCKSHHGAIVAADGLYAVSRYGLALTTLTMEYNSQLRVQHVSDAIEPVFLKQYGTQLSLATLFSVNDVLYMTFGSADGDLDNIIFCYDVDTKAWWTYSIDVDEPILNMLHIDHESHREGIGIITPSAIYLLPTIREDNVGLPADYDILIESAEISTTSPVQGMHHLSQLEFRFDTFIGDLDIVVTCVDQFGRTIQTKKRVSHQTLQHQLAEYVRIDKVVESYKITLTGRARMRLTHFMAKVYPKSHRIGMVWGFDSQQSHSSPGSIHRTFSSYNDLKKAIIP